MKPRGAVESFLATASLSGLLFGSLWAVFTGAPAEEATIIGLCFGVIASALSVGKLTEVSRRVTVPDRDLFVADLQGRLAALGFFAKAELPTYRHLRVGKRGDVHPRAGEHERGRQSRAYELRPGRRHGGGASLGAGSVEPLDPRRR